VQEYFPVTVRILRFKSSTGCFQGGKIIVRHVAAVQQRKPPFDNASHIAGRDWLLSQYYSGHTRSSFFYLYTFKKNSIRGIVASCSLPFMQISITENQPKKKPEKGICSGGFSGFGSFSIRKKFTELKIIVM
jgi:hypothetical protein